MPCQCATSPTAAEHSETTATGCECASEPEAPSDRELKLERLVMELDQRVRKLEGATG